MHACALHALLNIFTRFSHHNTLKHRWRRPPLLYHSIAGSRTFALLMQHARQVQAAVVTGSKHYRTQYTNFPLLARTLHQSSADQTTYNTLSALHWVGSSGIGLLLPFRRLHLGRFQGTPQLARTSSRQPFGGLRRRAHRNCSLDFLKPHFSSIDHGCNSTCNGFSAKGKHTCTTNTNFPIMHPCGLIVGWPKPTP